MYQIDNDTAVASQPTRPAAGSLKFFSGGNPGSGQAATIVEDWFLNMLQNELANVVVAGGGLTLDKSDDTQLLQAIQAVVAAAAPAGHGQCHLDYSGGNLQLLPFAGNRLWVNGASRVIPDAGVNLAGGQVANTTYDIYAYWNSSGAGSLELEAATVGHTLTDGIRVKSGDATRTLVGKARTDGTGNWQSGPLTISYFNRRPKSATKTGSGFNTTSTTLVEISTSLRNGFVTWGDVRAIGSVNVRNSAVTEDVFISLGVDSAAHQSGASVPQWQNGDDLVGQVSHLTTEVSEGYHFVTPIYYVSGGTGFANSSNCQVEVMG